MIKLTQQLALMNLDTPDRQVVPYMDFNSMYHDSVNSESPQP